MFQLFSYLECCNVGDINPIKYILSDTSVSVNDLKPIKLDVFQKDVVSIGVEDLKPLKVNISEMENVKVFVKEKKTIKITIECPC